MAEEFMAQEAPTLVFDAAPAAPTLSFGVEEAAQEAPKAETKDNGNIAMEAQLSAEELAAKAEAGYEFIEDEENRKTFALVLKEVLKLLKHIRPRSLKGYLELGLEDPYTMGQIMSAAAFFWPFYQENFRFTPVLDEKKLDGEVHMKGHLRLGYAALCALRLLLDRNFRKLLRMVLNR